MMNSPFTKELWSYTKVKVGDTVTDDGVLNYVVTKVIEVESPAMQGTHLEVLNEG